MGNATGALCCSTLEYERDVRICFWSGVVVCPSPDSASSPRFKHCMCMWLSLGVCITAIISFVTLSLVPLSLHSVVHLYVVRLF